MKATAKECNQIAWVPKLKHEIQNNQHAQRKNKKELKCK